MVYLTVDRTGLSYGNYETTVMVTTSEGIVEIPVTLEVTKGDTEGIKRICDFETGSLAHAWNKVEPYSVGWWDAHGNPEDRDSPYIYRFSLDQTEKPDTGGLSSMKIEFNMANGDTKNGRFYLSFGTYGHKTVTTGDDGEEVTYNATGDWKGYASFKFDIRDLEITNIPVIMSSYYTNRRSKHEDIDSDAEGSSNACG